MHVLGICAQNDLIDGDMRNLFFFFPPRLRESRDRSLCSIDN